MEYVAYTFIVLALLLELRDSVKGGKDSIQTETKIKLLSTTLFLSGVITYLFSDYLVLVMICFIVMTVISSWMLGISTAVVIEDEYEGISSELKKKRKGE